MKVIKNKYVRLITGTFWYYYKHKFNCIKSLRNCHSLLQFHLNFITTKKSSFNSTVVYYLYIFVNISYLQFFQLLLWCTSLQILHVEHFCRVYNAGPKLFFEFLICRTNVFSFFTFQYLSFSKSKKVNIGATSRKFKKITFVRHCKHAKSAQRVKSVY